MAGVAQLHRPIQLHLSAPTIAVEPIAAKALDLVASSGKADVKRHTIWGLSVNLFLMQSFRMMDL